MGRLSFVGMMIVSKIDYHFYGAFSFELYIFAMILMALVQTPLGVDDLWGEKMDTAAGKYDTTAFRNYKNCSDFIPFL